MQADPDMSFSIPLEQTIMIPPQPPPQDQPPPAESSSSSRGSKRSPEASVDPVTAVKRQRNNEAARKYRQKRIDRISELEAALSEVQQERDDLRIRLARQEAEAAALRSMLQLKSGVKDSKD